MGFIATKLTKETEAKLLQFADNLLAGEEDVYTAWTDSGLSNTFQIYFNKIATERFRGKVLAGNSTDHHFLFAKLAIELAGADPGILSTQLRVVK